MRRPLSLGDFLHSLRVAFSLDRLFDELRKGSLENVFPFFFKKILEGFLSENSLLIPS